MTESRTLEDLLPDPRDRAFIEGVYRDLGQEWAAETLGYMLTHPEVELRDKFNGTATDLGREWAAAILKGMLDGSIVEWERVEMGHVKARVEGERYPHTHEHHGRKYLVNQDTGNCWYCQQIIEHDEDKTEVHPRQMTLGQTPQPTLEGI